MIETAGASNETPRHHLRNRDMAVILNFRDILFRLSEEGKRPKGLYRVKIIPTINTN
ncbi:uncharacterized protein BX663DRAFT_527519 [Cokeromyces recurvatus]|uniref:uncharacterized protein n=1 Tax=Cokeromyces recurvatus TaxID=90255 RepID=UPI00221EE90C|nr:uncharacterized protein BX663DRAFT_527519 [Cokeromyces recurvatus]KAI7897668.1 hypothetical protein BX663DRAFT_527519 [Cokeromyces recurvatus]